jgi:hypothetical protein
MKMWLWELLILVLWLMYNSLHQHFHRDMEITSRLICIMILVHVKNFELINHACSYQRKLSVDGGAGALHKCKCKLNGGGTAHDSEGYHQWLFRLHAL